MRPVALAAVAWSLAFAAIHVAWALGFTAGLAGRRVTGLLLAIDIVAIPLCLLAAWIAWRLRDRRAALQAPPIVYRLAWAAAVVLGLRGLGTIQALIAPPDDATTLTRLVDPSSARRRALQRACLAGGSAVTGATFAPSGRRAGPSGPRHSPKSDRATRSVLSSPARRRNLPQAAECGRSCGKGALAGGGGGMR